MLYFGTLLINNFHKISESDMYVANYHTIFYLWHMCISFTQRTEHALFLLFFARFRSEVIEMEGAREGKGRGMKFTIQRNLFKQQLIEETRSQNLKKKIPLPFSLIKLNIYLCYCLSRNQSNLSINISPFPSVRVIRGRVRVFYTFTRENRLPTPLVSPPIYSLREFTRIRIAYLLWRVEESR